jgi:hypothetical protein
MIILPPTPQRGLNQISKSPPWGLPACLQGFRGENINANKGYFLNFTR